VAYRSVGSAAAYKSTAMASRDADVSKKNAMPTSCFTVLGLHLFYTTVVVTTEAIPVRRASYGP